MQLSIVSANKISTQFREQAIGLCTRAFEEDFRPYMDSFEDATHILGIVDGHLATHALWITRWLQVGESEPLRTAYVEAVATEPAYRGRGYATAVMEEVVLQIQAYEIGGLAPFNANYYGRLGWELWQGPLFERKGDRLERSPADEEVMIYRLLKTPSLDLTMPISIEWRAGEVW